MSSFSATAWRRRGRSSRNCSSCYDLDLPIVATNEPYFATQEDFEAHDALICIAEGSYVAVDERRRLSPEHYFKTSAQMRALFADLPEALENTVEIARRCAYRPLQRQPILPPFLTGGEASTALGETEAAELGASRRPGSRTASPNTAWRPALTPPPMPSGSPSNSMSSLA